MVRILVIQHEDEVGALRFGEWLRDAGAELIILRPDQGEQVPVDLSGYHGLVVLGGTAAPDDDDVWPWLPAVRELQLHTAAAHQPAFNICLGAQLAALAHGGEIFRRASPQIGVMSLRTRPEAGRDPVFHVLSDRPKAVLWHQEQIAAPPAGAVHLVEGTDAPVQAYRMGESSWSVQFHPEPDEPTIRQWARGTADLVAKTGRTAEDLVAEYCEHQDEIEQTFKPLAAAFVAHIRDRVTSS